MLRSVVAMATRAINAFSIHYYDK